MENSEENEPGENALVVQSPRTYSYNVDARSLATASASSSFYYKHPKYYKTKNENDNSEYPQKTMMTTNFKSS